MAKSYSIGGAKLELKDVSIKYAFFKRFHVNVNGSTVGVVEQDNPAPGEDKPWRSFVGHAFRARHVGTFKTQKEAVEAAFKEHMAGDVR